MKLYIYGSNKKHDNIDIKEKRPLPFILMPNSRTISIWNIVLMFLMLYTAIYIPYKTSFIDDTSDLVNYIELFIDSLFIFDILVNFVSAYEDS